MARKVQALYDFEAQGGTGELSIISGDILTVIRTDVGDGWWEGSNTRGESGLFPEAYVEEYSGGDDDDGAPPPAMAPPPLPQDYGGGTAGGFKIPAPPAAAPIQDDDWGWKPDEQTNNSARETTGARYGNVDDDLWSTNTGNDTNYNQASSTNAAPAADPYDPFGTPPNVTQEPPPMHSATAITNQGYDQDDWDSDFDDDNNGHAAPMGMSAPSNTGQPQGGHSLAPPAIRNNPQHGSLGDVSSIGRGADSKRSSTKTSFNRFSTFVKSGGESFVLGKLNAKVQEADVIQVVDNGDGKFSWLNVKPPYSCAVASPKKESKLKGLKSYIAYQLTPSLNNIQVSRRYKHFDWLHERLVEKYTFVPIPALPDKQIQGRYEEDFIEHRMNQLQSFVDRVCRHPVLSQSEVWQHFLTCTDDRRWKTGKRKAEKDPLVGGSCFMAIRTPEKPMDNGIIDHEIEVFTKFSLSLDSAVKNMHKTAAEQTQRCQNHFKREYQTVGKAFNQLGLALQQDGNYLNPNLTNAIVCTGETYEEIAKMVDDQPRNDWEPLGDMMHDYRGMLAGWPSVLQIHAGALSKKKEFEKMSQEGKAGQAEVQEIANRTDTLSYALLAEINTFHNQRVKDMKTAHQHFLQEQITFYQKMVEKLQDSLRMYDSC